MALVAELLPGYFLISSSRVLRAAPRSPIVSCALAMESMASGAFGLSGQEVSSFLCADDGVLVVALAGIGHADPVLRIGRERAARIGDEEALHRGDRERVVAELELVERRLVGLRLGLRRLGIGALRRRRRRLLGRGGLLLARLLEPAQAGVDVEVELLLAAFRRLDLVADDLELAAHARHVAAQGLDLRGEVEQRAAVRAAVRGFLRRGFGLAQARLGRLAVGLDLLAQQLDAPARLVVVEQALGNGGARRQNGEDPECQRPQHQYSPP